MSLFTIEQKMVGGCTVIMGSGRIEIFTRLIKKRLTKRVIEDFMGCTKTNITNEIIGKDLHFISLLGIK